MDPRLLSLYEQELRYFRESAGEFSKQFPKIAGRLGVKNTEIADPYVERLIEATAFLSARVGLKLQAEYPHFTQSILETAFPNYLSPTPSMTVFEFEPDLLDAQLAAGLRIPRGSAIRALQVAGQNTYCEFTTTSSLTLFPLEIQKAQYFRYAPDLPLTQHPRYREIQGGVRIQLASTADVDFSHVQCDELTMHLSGAEDVAWSLHECLLNAPIGVMVRPLTSNGSSTEGIDSLPGSSIEEVGFSDDEAMLPAALAGFSGHRLMHQYFAFPQAFQFFRFSQLQKLFARYQTNQIEIIVLFSRGNAELEKLVSAENFKLNCVPAINLFSKRLDRVQVSDATNEFHLLADRTRPQDFEIHSISEVIGFGQTTDSAEKNLEQTFFPFYGAFHGNRFAHPAYYTTRREPRVLSSRQGVQGNRTSYIGSEVYIQLVDPQEAPYSLGLRQLGVSALCTNRDLPLLLSAGKSAAFELVSGLAVNGIRIARGPSRPTIPLYGHHSNWILIDQLSSNYLSIADSSPEQAATLVRELLLLHSKLMDQTMQSQISGLKTIHSKPITRRLPMKGPIAFGRGIEITAEVDEQLFHGGSVFLFASMLDHWFRRHASTNSFIETVLRSHQGAKDVRARFMPRFGDRAVL